LFNLQGDLIQQEARRYKTTRMRPDWSEQDPQDWWKALKDGVRALTTAEDFAHEVIAISVTAHMHGLIAIDRDGHPITNCWTLFDRRSGAEANYIAQVLGEGTAFKITGARLEAYTPAAKILWLKRHRRDDFDKAALFVSPKDLVRIQLGSELVTDPVDAAGTLLFDLRTGAWSKDILSALGLPIEKLPEIMESTTQAGTLSNEAAEQLELPAGIPIVTGAGDDVEALGAGIVNQGQTLEHIGTTGTMITCLESPIFDDAGLVELYPHTIPGLYLLGGATNAAGRSLDWALNVLSSNDKGANELPLSYPEDRKNTSPPIYLPFISGERGLLWEAYATGAFFGLREVHTALDLALSVYHGVAFSMKEFLEAAKKLGAEPTDIISGTPPTQWEWAQLRADIYGFPILFPKTSYPTGLGAGMLAMVNQNIFPSLNDAVKACCRVSQRVDPDLSIKAYYQERYDIYQAAVQACRPLFSRLN
jgi:xylulokinase